MFDFLKLHSLRCVSAFGSGKHKLNRNFGENFDRKRLRSLATFSAVFFIIGEYKKYFL